MLLALPLVILGAALAARAEIPHDHGNNLARHHRLARSPVPTPFASPTKLRKRNSCKAPTTSSSKTTSSQKTTTSTKKTTTTTAKPTPTAAVENGIITIEVSRCGSNGATIHTESTTSTTGPNGSEEWINCGITTSGGWDPPYLTVDDIVTMTLYDALKDDNSPFQVCSKYIDYFDSAASKYGLKAIMLASFALQESSCNPNSIGGGNTQGLMQISTDKCVGAPGGNCLDPEFNIDAGAKYFASVLSSNGGNLLLSVGNYNGWYQGLTVSKAEAAKYGSCCLCQQNLDYVFQWINGWVLNQNAYEMGLGKYNNLDACGDD
ncbi:SLT domain-containing protein [Mycena chlorophos]|uniref:SLT domain-containing protein n=1 Tax=Mycena chlorophos TaxID=658473 RepID=A0A8H6SUF4_MYCCL|nr:SLT domain-containing protein [Mycena chlorophos]